MELEEKINCQKITTVLARNGLFLVLVAKYHSSQDRIILLKWNNLEESLSTAFDISRKKVNMILGPCLCLNEQSSKKTFF